MKNILLAVAVLGAASSAYAGNLSEPMVEAPVIVEQAADSSQGIWLPILLLLLVAAAVAGSSGGAAPGPV